MVCIKELLPLADNRKSYYGKAYVYETPKGWLLRSYDTFVALVTRNGKFIRIWGGYSATTMRHVNSFTWMYVPGRPGGKAWWDSLPVKNVNVSAFIGEDWRD